MRAAGTRERIIAANKYNPGCNVRFALRKTRVVGTVQQTFKKKGDIVIRSDEWSGLRVEEVEQNGWH